jgi:hypothetical protein
VLCMLSCFDINFDGFLYFTCGVSDLVGRRIEMGVDAMIYTPKFHKDWFKQLKVDRAGDTFTNTHTDTKVTS